MGLTNFISGVGNGTSWITAKVNLFLANLFGVEITIWQDKLITILLIGLIVFVLLTILKSLRKVVKWILIIILIILGISVLISIFA